MNHPSLFLRGLSMLGYSSDAVKVVKIKLNVPLPKVAEVARTLPDTDEPVTLTIA